MPQALLQLLQCVGWSKVLASSHSWDSLLHCTVAREVMSSDRQFEQTGVDRVACRLALLAGSGFRLNGLSSDACFMWWPAVNRITYPGGDDSAPMMRTSSSGLSIVVDCSRREPDFARKSAST